MVYSNEEGRIINLKKILLVFGTRPEAIKMAPLVKAFENEQTIESKICVTAQHREMLDQVLELFDIKPDYDLNLMKPGQDLYDITANVLLGMKDILAEFKPDIVLVHGDTTTTSSASLAAFYQQIKVGHVEAGLRTGNIYSPFPEEINRQITGVLANYHFTPTTTSRDNLFRENKDATNIIITGNTVIDALFLALKKIINNKDLEEKIKAHLLNLNYEIKDENKIILVTGHRRENHGQSFINICEALKEIAIKNGVPKDIVYRKKMGFTPPLRKWTADIKDNIGDVLFSDNLSFLNREVLQDIYDFHYKNNEILASKIWGLYVLGVWLKYYIK
jgi:UDP-N-acetylglucosamine 2-epimerase (non-hydrolysing)